MDLLNTVLFVMSFYSFLNRYAQAVALCQDLDKDCSYYAKNGFCDTHANVKEQCPLSCKQCVPTGNSLPSSTRSPLSSTSQSPLSSTSSSLSISMTSSQSISPTQSTVVVLRSSINKDGSTSHWKDNITTIRATASKRNLEHAKILMIIGTLWCCLLFP